MSETAGAKQAIRTESDRVPLFSWIAFVGAIIGAATIAGVAAWQRNELRRVHATVDSIREVQADLSRAFARAWLHPESEHASSLRMIATRIPDLISDLGLSEAEAEAVGANAHVLASQFPAASAPADPARLVSAFEALDEALQSLVENQQVRLESVQTRQSRSWNLSLAICGALLLVVAVGSVAPARQLTRKLNRLRSAEAQLRESQAALQRAQHLGRMGSWTADLVNNRFLGSPEAVRLVGFKSGTLDFEQILEQTHPDDRPRLQATWEQALKSGTYNIEHRMLVHGETRWMHVKAEIEHDSTGRPVRASGITIDVTERREAENALRETEARLQAFADHLTDVLWIIDPRMPRLIYVSRAFETLWGRAPASLYSNYNVWHEGVHPDDRERVRDEFRNKSELGLYDTEYRVLRPDGSVLWIRDRGFPVYDDHGQLLYVAGIAEDVTARKRMEKSLRASETRFRQLAEFLPLLVWAAQADGRLDYTSQRWSIYLGAGHAELRDQGWLDVVHPDDRTFVAETWARAVRDGSDFQAEYRIRRYDGEYRWFESTAIPMRDENGTVTRWLGSSTDIHDARSMRDELQRLNVELEQRVVQRTHELEATNRELEAFSYSISHDLRAPLRTIDGFSEAIMEDFAKELPPEAQRFLQLIRQGAQRMAMLIEDLLAFSRLNRQQLNRSHVSMLRLVNDVLEELRPEIGSRQVELEIGALPSVEADPKLARQVWLNLLSNALKYSRGRSPARISVNSRMEDGELVFEVADNGAGFDMAYASKLFGVFQRLHNDSEFEGTGVGLAIVQRIVHRHGGRIWASSAINEGATFSFTLGSLPTPATT